MQKISMKGKEEKIICKKMRSAEMKKTVVKQKGITLIALIVTIIIMLILAGVTIGAVMGNRGILNNAKIAATAYKNAEAKEKVALILQEYEMKKTEAESEGKEPESYDEFLKDKENNGDIDGYDLNDDGTPSKIVVNDIPVPIINGKPQMPDNNNGTNHNIEEAEDGIIYEDVFKQKHRLNTSTPVGTKIAMSKVDEQMLDWYLFDIDKENNEAYLLSTPSYWVPDTTKPTVEDAFVPKLVSEMDSSTYAIRQAICQTQNGDKSYSEVKYSPSPEVLANFRKKNSSWNEMSKDIGRTDENFKSWEEREQGSCYLLDENIFAGIKKQINESNGNLKGKVKSLVGGPSIEQWVTAYNKQDEAKGNEITAQCEQQDNYPIKIGGYTYKNSKKTGEQIDSICGSFIYGAACTNGFFSTDSSQFYNNQIWYIASPSKAGSDCICSIFGYDSNISRQSISYYNVKLTMLMTVNLGKNGDKDLKTTVEKSLPETDCKGYYADIDGNPDTVEGIIFADLTKSESGNWKVDKYNNEGGYSYPAITNGLKQYKISKDSYTDPNFGTHPVISPISGTKGKDRFYVMSLRDLDENIYYWYYSASNSSMTDYKRYTSTDFGKGKENTSKMIKKWNEKGYGEQNKGDKPDMWGVIQDKANEGWFIPSKGEWAAFGNQLQITPTNTYGMKKWYHSSSAVQDENNDHKGWVLSTVTAYLYAGGSNAEYVRLATTF